jgi:hypothetical protein
LALDSLATAVSVPTTTYVPAYAPLAPRPFVDALTPESTHRIDSAPLPLLGAADTTVAVSPLAHGLTTPGSITATRPTPRRLPASDDWRGAFDAERAVLTLSRLAAASHPELIERAVTSYARFLEQHGDEVRNPYYYVVDYGLSNLTPRGYLFDMQSLTVVDGPFMVAHGSRSLAAADGVPRSFGNADESKKTSLGFFTTGALYAFRGHSNGRPRARRGDPRRQVRHAHARRPQRRLPRPRARPRRAALAPARQWRRGVPLLAQRSQLAGARPLGG